MGVIISVRGAAGSQLAVSLVLRYRAFPKSVPNFTIVLAKGLSSQGLIRRRQSVLDRGLDEARKIVNAPGVEWAWLDSNQRPKDYENQAFFR